MSISKRCIGALLFTLVAPVAGAPAQTPAEQLLRYVPSDYPIGILVNDLRGQSERWSKLPWAKSLQQSSLYQSILKTPESQKLTKLQTDLKNHLGVDWPTLRDDILGDAVVFAFRPAAPNATQSDNEHGLILLQAPKPEALESLIERLNALQKRSGELRKLEERKHNGAKYFYRLTNKDTQYYAFQEGFLAVSGSESALRQVLDRRRQSAVELPRPLAWASKQAGIITAWLNPRFFDKELEEKSQARTPDAEFVKIFLTYWRALDVIGVSLHVGDTIEGSLTLQAREKDLPPAAQKLFRESARSSELWTRFPDNALFAVAGRFNAAAVVEKLADSLPPPMRSLFMDGLKKSVGAALGLNVLRDVLPNVGPDWGICVLPVVPPSSPGPGGEGETAHVDQSVWPQAIAALAVRPGEKKVDQALLKGVHLAAGALVFFYNQSHSDDPIQLKNTVQDKIEITYLANDKLFPAGVRPAFALKDGYLLVASSPAAISRFKPAAGQALGDNEALLMRISTAEIAKLLHNQRQTVIHHISEKNRISNEAAEHGLEGVLSVLDLIHGVELSERTGGGEVVWTLRARLK